MGIWKDENMLRKLKEYKTYSPEDIKPSTIMDLFGYCKYNPVCLYVRTSQKAARFEKIDCRAEKCEILDDTVKLKLWVEHYTDEALERVSKRFKNLSDTEAHFGVNVSGLGGRHDTEISVVGDMVVTEEKRFGVSYPSKRIEIHVDKKETLEAAATYATNRSKFDEEHSAKLRKDNEYRASHPDEFPAPDPDRDAYYRYQAKQDEYRSLGW